MTYERLLDGINSLCLVAKVAVAAASATPSSLRRSRRSDPRWVIKELVGHLSISTTMRYVTVTGDQLDAITRVFGQQVDHEQNAIAEKRKPSGSSS